MAEFVNTLDIMGDEELLVSILNRSITEFKDNILKIIGTQAFFDCRSLTVVDLPNVVELGERAFTYCNALTSINIPKAKTLGVRAMSYDTLLTEINLPVVLDIFASCFEGCTNLERIDIGSTATIARSAFTNAHLNTLILRSTTMCTLSSISALEGTDIDAGVGYIYVPEAIIEEYRSGTNWSAWSSQFRAIEDYSNICG